MYGLFKNSRLVLVLSLIILCVGLPIASPVPATADEDTWSAMTSCTDVSLWGMWGSSSSDVFAVGDSGTIIHYDGSSWSSMESGTTADLRGIWGISSTNVYITDDTGGILHYDGSTWSGMDSGTTANLRGIWGSSSTDIFAVGSGGTVLHYNGSTWSEMVSGTTDRFYLIWGSSSTDVFVAGSGGILHYDGSTWNDINSGTEGLISVWGNSSTDVFTAGMGTILQYDGSSWSSMESGTTVFIPTIWGTSSSDVFAGGFAGTILHYDGSSWSSMESGTTAVLRGIWGSSSSDVFAVGSGGTILHYPPQPPQPPLSTPPTITYIYPSGAYPGDTLNINIEGDNFIGASAVSFGADITINSFNVNSDTQITANITIATDAPVWTYYDVMVTTPDGVAVASEYRGLSIYWKPSYWSRNWEWIVGAIVGSCIVVSGVAWVLVSRRRRLLMPHPIGRFCPDCGVELEGPGRFCQNCGIAQLVE
ncbi:WD40/YVTN/BNR-like repeat-containing protein [Chloroflexota bacterium]